MNKHKTTEIGKLENELLNFREKSEKNPENEEYINRLQDTENELKSKYKTREGGKELDQSQKNLKIMRNLLNIFLGKSVSEARQNK